MLIQILFSLSVMLLAAAFGAGLGVWRYGWPGSAGRLAPASIRLTAFDPVQGLTIDIRTFTVSVTRYSGSGFEPSHEVYVRSDVMRRA